ncbi:MAG: hypothetical protein AAB488_02805 [Patescibacteria group bacterium]
MYAQRLQDYIKKIGDTDIKVSLTADQAVSSSCIRTQMTKTIDYYGIKTTSEVGCDDLYQRNIDFQYFGGCPGEHLMQAQGEKVTCKKIDGTDETAMCCPVYDSRKRWNWLPITSENSKCPLPATTNLQCDNIKNERCRVFDIGKKVSCVDGGKIKTIMCCGTSDTNKKWVFIDSKNPKCPSPSAFNNLFKNLAGLVKPVGNALNNAVVIATAAISAATVGI